MKLGDRALLTRKEQLVGLRSELALLQEEEKALAARKRDCLEELLWTRRMLFRLGDE